MTLRQYFCTVYVDICKAWVFKIASFGEVDFSALPFFPYLLEIQETWEKG